MQLVYLADLPGDTLSLLNVIPAQFLFKSWGSEVQTLRLCGRHFNNQATLLVVYFMIKKVEHFNVSVGHFYVYFVKRLF